MDLRAAMSDHGTISLSVAGDIISAAAVAGTLMGYLPDIAAFAAMIWYLIQIWDWYQERRRKNDAGT